MDSGQLTAHARAFLEDRFARAADGTYFPHQPLHGLYGGSEPGQPLRLARTYRLLRWVEALRPDSLADLGAAEGYIANLVRLRCQCPTLCVDLSLEACHRAAEIHSQPALASPLQSIPLADDSVDVVLLSEVFEHLEDPLQVIRELVRVARRYVVITTQEICLSRSEQRIRLRLRDLGEAHGELNWLCTSDLHALFGADSASAPQFRRSLRRLSEHVPAAQAGEHLRWLARPAGRAHEGVIFVASLDGSPVPPMPDDNDDELWQMLIKGPPVAGPAKRNWTLADGRTVNPGEALDSGLSAAEALQCRTDIRPPLDEAGMLRLSQLLDTDRVSHSRGERWLLSKLVRWMERIGYLTCTDPLAVRLAWLRSRLLPRSSTAGEIAESELSSS